MTVSCDGKIVGQEFDSLGFVIDLDFMIAQYQARAKFGTWYK